MLNGCKREFKTDDGSVWLMQGDCLEILPQLEGIDAIVTDPPWGVNNDNDNESRGRGGRPYAPTGRARKFSPVVGDDKAFDPVPFLNACENVCLWGANHFASRLPSS
jgi:site-specific DNA-methyltransferase (adenine-specific)